MTSTCPTCNSQVQSTQKFCTTCGTRVNNVATIKLCIQCSATIPSSAKFCISCGTDQNRFGVQKNSISPTKEVRVSSPITRTSSIESTSSKSPRISTFLPCTHLYLVAPELENSNVITELQSREGVRKNTTKNTILIVEGTEALVTCRRYLKQHRFQKPQVICIVAPPEIIPHIAYADPTGKDEHLWTDNPYGMMEEPTETERFCGHALPEIAVCRIPSLDTLLIERLLNVQNTLYPSWENGIAFTAKCWERASREVLDQIGGSTSIPLHCSPNMVAKGLFHTQVGRVYFNVHGSNLTPCTGWRVNGSRRLGVTPSS